MTLYVDTPKHPYGRLLMAHMTADYVSELMAAADALDIERRHFQAPPAHRHAHFDVCKTNQARAIATLDARLVSSRVLATAARRLANAVRHGANGPRPIRIRLSREAGYRKPSGAIVVTRSTRWGNPFKWQDAPEGLHPAHRRALAVEAFANAIHRNGYIDGPRGRVSIDEIRADLAGRALACWCPLDGPCHAETLITIANTLQPMHYAGEDNQ